MARDDPSCRLFINLHLEITAILVSIPFLSFEVMNTVQTCSVTSWRQIDKLPYFLIFHPFPLGII
jgi:hypothetical protein